MECHAYFDNIYTGHSTHFQVGGDDSKVEGESSKTSMQNKAIFYRYFHLNIFIFENKVTGEKCN